MNRILQTFDSIKPSACELVSRLSCLIQRKPYYPPRRPRWQQLELPLSHTRAAVDAIVEDGSGVSITKNIRVRVFPASFREDYGVV